MNPHVWWYMARAAGIVAWVMLTASIIWGVVLTTGAFPRQRRPAWLLDLHRWLGGLTVVFLAVHLGSLIADNYVTFTLPDVTVPYSSSWRPGAVALGIVAMWLLVAVEVTSLAMRRLPRRIWRWIHLTSYATFLLVSLHAAFAGSDHSNWLYRTTAAAVTTAVTAALIYRIAAGARPRRVRPRTATPSGRRRNSPAGGRQPIPALTRSSRQSNRSRPDPNPGRPDTW